MESCRALASSAELDLEALSITEIDADGEVITAYIFADNYFELYVAGTLVAVDPVPFTPFNSNVVRFRAQRPFDVAMMLVDWEENLGLGSEAGQGNPHHPGDGGLVARFEDEAGRPVGWAEEGFDDGAWPQASTFTNETVGVDNKPAYTNFPDIWDDPEFDPVFIWSDNLVRDNVVLVRGRIGS